MNISEQQRTILTEELIALKDRIISNHRNAGQVASGRTIRSMTIKEDNDSSALYGRKAFGTLEKGRKRGPAPKGFNEIIKQWIIDKGISVQPIPYKRTESDKWKPKYTPEQRGLMSLSGAIANKIVKEGTRLHRSGGRDDVYSSEILKTLQAVRDRISKMYELEFDNITLNNKV